MSQWRCWRLFEASSGGMIIVPEGSVGTSGCERVKRVSGKLNRSLLMTNKDSTGSEIRASDCSDRCCCENASDESPADVTPGRFARRSEVSGRRDASVESRKSSASKDEIERCVREGKRRNIDTKTPCSKIAPSCPCITKVVSSCHEICISRNMVVCSRLIRPGGSCQLDLSVISSFSPTSHTCCFSFLRPANAWYKREKRWS